MKTILTTALAIAIMTFAFSAPLSYANEVADKISGCTDEKRDKAMCKRVDNLRDPEQADNERAVADSGNEDSSTSAASENGQ